METVLIHQSLLFVNLQLKGNFFSELKRNYQELLLKHHPDKNGGKESETFLAVDKAWKILGDEKQRAIYDAEMTNAKLELEQDAAVWLKMKLSDLELDNDMHFYKCRCGGAYQVDVQVGVDKPKKMTLCIFEI